jgi:hypothetical protein
MKSIEPQSNSESVPDGAADNDALHFAYSY